MTAPAGDDQMRNTRTFPAATPTSPRVLKAADEAPCGSFMVWADHDADRRSSPWELLTPEKGQGYPTLRLPNGNGWHVWSDPLRGDGWSWTNCSYHRPRGPVTLIAEGLTETECRHLSGLSAQEAIAWCEARAKRPQPGDVVPWAEVEDGALYARTSTMFPFRAVVGPRHVTLEGPDDQDLVRLLEGRFGNHVDELRARTEKSDSVLVARDLGSDPEAWRRAMREWTANGNRSKPARDWTDLTGLTITIDGKQVTGFADDTWTITSVRPAPAANVPADLSPLAPLRANLQERIGLDLSGCGPERVVALALERIEADRREIERLRAANAEARRALETPGRQGLRALAEPKVPSWQRVKIHTLEAEAVTRRADLESARAELDRLRGVVADLSQAHADRDKVRASVEAIRRDHARSVDVLTAQRDEARRALAEEKIKTTRLERDLVAVGDLGSRSFVADADNAPVARVRRSIAALVADRDRHYAEATRLRGLLDAHAGSTTALVKPLRLAMGWGDRTDISPERTVEAAAEHCRAAGEQYVRDQHRIADLERLLDGRYYFPATVLEPLRDLVPASAVNAEQVVAAVREDLAGRKARIADLERALTRQTEDRRAAEAGAGQATMLLNAWQCWARPLWPEGPPNPADAALRSAIEGRVTRGIPLPNNAALARLRAVMPAAQCDQPSEGRTPSDMIVNAAERLLHFERRAKDADARAEKAERNLCAAAELLAA